MLTRGKSAPLWLGCARDGELESPAPKRFGETTNQRAGSRVRPGPISHSLSACVPPYAVGSTTTLERSASRVPYVA
jgi:hypothetical protein